MHSDSIVSLTRAWCRRGVTREAARFIRSRKAAFDHNRGVVERGISGVMAVLAVAVALLGFVACAGGPGTVLVRDIDGHTYHAVTIGSQVWLAENLRVTRMPDGEPLPTYAPNNEPGRVEDYGRLYSWASAQRACPRGWHLPSDAEWTALESIVGAKAASLLRDRDYWPPQVGSPGSGRLGFRARPAGYWNDQGFETFFGERAVFWTSTARDANLAWSRVVSARDDTVRRAPQHPQYGFSVRCLQDSQPGKS